MKRFIIKTLIIFLFALVIAIVIEFVVRGVPNPYRYKISLIEKQKEDVQLLILGSSTAYNGINPSFFDKKALNMSLGGQGIMIDAFLVNRYLHQMPNLEAIILPIGYGTLFLPDVFGFPDGLMSYRVYYKYDPNCFSFDSYEFFHRHSVRVKLERMLRGDIPQFADSLGFHGENFIGINFKGEGFDFYLEAENAINGMTTKDHNLIDKNIKALHQIAELSEKANVKLVIVSIPFHKSFRDLDSPTQWSFIDSVIDSVIKQYDNSLYLNYYSTAIPDTCYANPSHLNIYGAELFSKMLAHDLDSIGVFQH
jgi:hypothetical protein